MIHYQLQCSAAHGFDAWFRDSAAYEDQAARGLLECPECGERQVVRALMTPAVARKGRKPRAAAVDAPIADAPPSGAPATPPVPSTPSVAVAGPQLPDQLRAMLQKMRAEVERQCDYVGRDFANEARRIHDGQSERRGIYGEATEGEAEALREDGIEVGSIPWVPRSDA